MLYITVGRPKTKNKKTPLAAPTVPVTSRIETAYIPAIESLARKEQRNVSNMISRLVSTHPDLLDEIKELGLANGNK